MRECSDFLNSKSSGEVQFLRNAKYRRVSYNLIVLDWYLKDWLASLQVSQADLVRLTDYPKAKVSDLVTGKQRYNRDILNEIAAALNLYPYELLMPPEEAMHRRRLVEAVQQFVGVPHGGLPAITRKRSPSAARPADHLLIG
jgi:transcriptional regulator with XRE-family HTH domain